MSSQSNETRNDTDPGKDPCSAGGWRWALFLVLLLVFGLIAWWVVPRLPGLATGSDGALSTLSGDGARSGSSVTIGLTGAPQSLDPRTDAAAARVLTGNVYQGLTALDQHNRPVPALAKSWTVTDGARLYTFHLDTAAKFSTGKSVTSQDVVWSLGQVIRRNLPGASRLQGVTKITNPTASSVTFQLARPDPDLLWTLATPMGAVFDSVTNADSFTATSAPAGSGAFAFSTIQRGPVNSDGSTATIRLQANVQHSTATGNRPGVSTVVLKYFNTQADEVAAYRKGTVQAALDIGGDQYQSVTADSTLSKQVRLGDTTSTLTVAFNAADNSLLSDKRLRQTQRMVLDRKAVVDALHGLGTPLGGPVTSLDPGYEDLTGRFPNDLGSARKLQSYYRTRTWTAAVSEDVPQPVLDSLQKSERASGNALDFRRMNAQDWKTNVTNGQDGKMQVDMAIWIDRGSHRASQWFTGRQWWKTDNPDADAAWEQATGSTTQASYEQGIRKAVNLLVPDQPATWLCQLKTASLWKQGISGQPVNMTDELVDLTSLRTA